MSMGKGYRRLDNNVNGFYHWFEDQLCERLLIAAVSCAKGSHVCQTSRTSNLGAAWFMDPCTAVDPGGAEVIPPVLRFHFHVRRVILLRCGSSGLTDRSSSPQSCDCRFEIIKCPICRISGRLKVISDENCLIVSAADATVFHPRWGYCGLFRLFIPHSPIYDSAFRLDASSG